MTIGHLSRIRAGRVKRARLPTVGNNAPVWSSTPVVAATEGVAESFDLDNYVSDPDGDALTITLNTGSVPLPTGWTYDGVAHTLDYDGTAGTLTSSGHIASASDGTDSTDSAAFDISVSAAATALQYPLTAVALSGNKVTFQDDVDTAALRDTVGLHDISVHFGGLGFASTQQMDADPVPANWVSRAVAYSEILGNHPTGEHICLTYVNRMEAADDGSIRANKVNAETGPNGQGDWWVRDAGDAQVSFFAGSFGINNSDYVVKDGDGYTYAEWYSVNVVQALLFDVLDTAGVQVGGLGGCGVWDDNFQYHANKSGADWNNDANNDDAQDYYDEENATHVSNDPVAVEAYSTFRANMRKGLELDATWQSKGAYDPSTNPNGIMSAGNTNQWFERYFGNPSGLRPDIIKEYRAAGETEKTFLNIGLAENMVGDAGSWMGIGPDAQPVSGGGQWRYGYNNIVYFTRKAPAPGYHFTVDLGCECAQNGTAGAAGIAVYPKEPSASANFRLFRWMFNTCQIAGSHCAISAYKTSDGNRARSPVIFDEYGFDNTATTKLFRKWAGFRIDPIPVTPLATHATGEFWGCETENAYHLVNTDNDITNPAASFDTSLLPGGASEWKRFLGVDDSTHNNGQDLGASIDVDPVDGYTFVRKSWYDAL